MANCIKLLKYSGAFRASLWKFIRLKQQKHQISLCCWRALYACMCWRVLDLHVCVYIFCILDLQGRVGKRAQCKRHRLPWTWSIPASSSQGKLFVVWSTNKGKKKKRTNEQITKSDWWRGGVNWLLAPTSNFSLFTWNSASRVEPKNSSRPSG